MTTTGARSRAGSTLRRLARHGGWMLLGGLLATSPAAASSIAFVRDGDVYLTTPDGGREHRVTSGGAYTAVTQSDDGTLFAHRAGVVDRLGPDGDALAAPAGIGTADGIDVTPDGSKLAVSYQAADGPRVTVRAADGGPAGWDDQSGSDMTWIGDDLALYANGGAFISTMARGTGSWWRWFGEPDGRKHASAITRSRDRLAVVVRDWDELGREHGPYRIAWYANSSPPPTAGDGLAVPPPEARPALRCVVDHGDAEPSHLSFSPDGEALAWEQAGGVHVAPVVDLGTCAQPPGGITIPGAASPDWGPADVPDAASAPTGRGDATARIGRRAVLRRAVTRGLPIAISCPARCVVTAVARRGGTVVGRERTTLSRQGRTTLALRVGRRGARLLQRRARARVQVAVTIRSDGERHTIRRAVELAR